MDIGDALTVFAVFVTIVAYRGCMHRVSIAYELLVMLVRRPLCKTLYKTMQHGLPLVERAVLPALWSCVTRCTRSMYESGIYLSDAFILFGLVPKHVEGDRRCCRHRQC